MPDPAEFIAAEPSADGKAVILTFLAAGRVVPIWVSCDSLQAHLLRIIGALQGARIISGTTGTVTSVPVHRILPGTTPDHKLVLSLELTPNAPTVALELSRHDMSRLGELLLNMVAPERLAPAAPDKDSRTH